MNRTDHRRPRTATRLAVGALASLAVVAGMAPASSAAPAAPVAPAAPAVCSTPLSGAGGLAPAITWLRCELEVNDNGFPGYSPGSVDGGSTLDAVMALSLNGQANDAVTVASLARVEAEVGGYVSDQGWGTGNERYAGPMAKALLAVQLQGGDPHDFGGFDLEAELRARIEVTGPDAGRFSDLSAYGNYSNGFGQALAVAALSHTDDGIPTAAVDFLLDQQCPGGGFRGSYDAPGGCTDDAVADTDYTAFALQALLSSPESATVDAGIADASDWLLDQQLPSGAFAGTGVTAEPNANTTGIAAQALRADGETAAADEAAAWLTTVQLTTANADSTPGAADFGAIAYSPAALTDAVTAGIPAVGRDQWRRSMGQSALGFAAGPYGAAPGEQPFAPFASWDAFVVRQYQDFEGRLPNAFEQAVWVLYLEAGALQPENLLVGLSAADVNSVDGRVIRFYNGFLNRPPTPVMQTVWAQRFTKGRTTASAAEEFLAASGSPYAGLSNDDFVDELYDRFQRTSPPAAAATWKLRLQQGNWTRPKVAAWFAESGPAKTISATDIQVFEVLKAMTGSTPTATYNADRAAAQAGTVTIADYALAILASPAYAARIA